MWYNINMIYEKNVNYIITCGRKYIDIDSYASIFAYREMLKALGYNAYACSSATVNSSVPDFILSFGYKFDDVPIGKNEFIILDVSNPDFFDDIVIKDKIKQVIDHHSGFESLWKKPSIIEPIGAIATIVYEMICKNNAREILNESLCKMLICAVLDNTLNFGARITTMRDRVCFDKLKEISKTDEDFIEFYFNECEKRLKKTFSKVIQDDIKIEKNSNLLPAVIGQIVVYNKNKVFDKICEINNIFSKYEDWFINIVCLEDGFSYLYSNKKESREKISKLFNCAIKNKYCKVPLILRKEIIKKTKDSVN